MSALHPHHLVRGTLVLAPYAPDGDSVRFTPDSLDSFAGIVDFHALRQANDGTLQLRLQGIDAPELHYRGKCQPDAVRARDALLAWAKEPPGHGARSLRAVVACARADAHGRPISYLLHPHAAPHAHDGAAIDLDEDTLRKTANAMMLAEGAAYLLAYATLPTEHHTVLESIARDARRHRRGVWRHDATREGVRIRSIASITEPTGALILPKLFRRVVDWLSDCSRGYHDDLHAWMREKDENDNVVLRPDHRSVPFDGLVHEQNDRVWLAADVLDLTFVDR